MSDKSNDKNDKVISTPRLSIRIPKNFNIKTMKSASNGTVSFRESDLMSPRTTTVSHPSSSLVDSKEVPRAALVFTDNESSPSIAAEMMELSSPLSSTTTTTQDDQILRNLVEDSIQGLKALAASAAASSIPENITQESDNRVGSPPEFHQLDEDQVLGSLFTCGAEEKDISTFYSKYCTAEKVNDAHEMLNSIISKADSLLQVKGISMSLKNILPFYLNRVIQQESARINKTDFTGLLLDGQFISASATVILLLPRLVSILLSVEEVSETLGANLFDVLLTIEPLLKAMPELFHLPETQKRLKLLQQSLLEESVWGDETLFKLLKLEFKQIQASNCPYPILSTLSGIRSSQKALETLTGFPSIGSRVTRLELFFRKYLRLAAHRLQCATLRLGLTQAVTQISWELFFNLIQREGYDEAASMFKNRHLNQILLATIFCSSQLMEQGRSFQQICQVLPSDQNNINWLSAKVPCDFYTFYTENFLPPLRGQIETFLNRKSSQESQCDKWILDGLFTTAPFPLSPVHQINGNVTLNRLNRMKPKYQTAKSSVTKYEWTCPFNPNEESEKAQYTQNTQNTQNTRNTQTESHIHLNPPQTPSNTSQLLNCPSSSPQTDCHQDLKRRPFHHHQFENEKGDRIKKVARRLDFNE